MDRASEFLRRAEDAERQAAGCIGVTREQFMDVAKQWRVMAQRFASGANVRTPPTD